MIMMTVYIHEILTIDNHLPTLNICSEFYSDKDFSDLHKTRTINPPKIPEAVVFTMKRLILCRPKELINRLDSWQGVIDKT